MQMEEALEKKIEGRVSVQLIINYLGEVRNVKLISGVGYGCDEEAMRLARLMEFEVASHYRKRVEFTKKINIHFKLPREQKKKQLSLNYQLVKENKNETEKSKKGYSYVIKF